MIHKVKLKKILLADDDADDREIFERVLGNKADVVLLRTMENGVEVLNFLKEVGNPEELPELIILDHNMPKMNGTETLASIRKDEKFSSIKVVIYSTNSDHTLQEKCRALGASMVAAKPSSMREYEAIIDRFLAIVN